jgi:hypothetical protein
MSKYIHRKIEGKKGTWLVPVNIINPADWVHVDTHDPKSRGYGGGMLEFELEDGTTYAVKGPWHSSGVFDDTGVLIADLHLTRLTIRENDKDGKILYEEKEPVLGPFMRGERIGQQLANIMNKELYIIRESEGGGSMHTAYPGKMPHVMAIRDAGLRDNERGYKEHFDPAWEVKHDV